MIAATHLGWPASHPWPFLDLVGQPPYPFYFLLKYKCIFFNIFIFFFVKVTRVIILLVLMLTLMESVKCFDLEFDCID
jgi:hypothetical protein